MSEIKHWNLFLYGTRSTVYVASFGYPFLLRSGVLFLVFECNSNEEMVAPKSLSRQDSSHNKRIPTQLSSGCESTKPPAAFWIHQHFSVTLLFPCYRFKWRSIDIMSCARVGVLFFHLSTSGCPYWLFVWLTAFWMNWECITQSVQSLPGLVKWCLWLTVLSFQLNLLPSLGSCSQMCLLHNSRYSPNGDGFRSTFPFGLLFLCHLSCASG